MLLSPHEKFALSDQSKRTSCCVLSFAPVNAGNEAPPVICSSPIAQKECKSLTAKLRRTRFRISFHVDVYIDSSTCCHITEYCWIAVQPPRDSLIQMSFLLLISVRIARVLTFYISVFLDPFHGEEQMLVDDLTPGKTDIELEKLRA